MNNKSLETVVAKSIQAPTRASEGSHDNKRQQDANKSSHRITVVLAEDHMIVRQGLKALLETDANIAVIGEAQTGREAIQLVKELKPDIVIMDIAMPSLNGLEATRQIVREHSSTKILILSSYSDPEHVEQLIDAGATGYLAKQTAASELLIAVREAAKGNSVFSPAIARRIRDSSLKSFTNGAPLKKERQILTSRETEVLQLIAEGYANKQIAGELSISIKTVEKHRQRIMDKLDIHQTAGLTRYAIDKRVIESHITQLVP